MRVMLRPCALLLGLALTASLPAFAQSPQARDSAEKHYRRALRYLERDEARIPSPRGILDAVTVWEDLLRLVGRDHLSRARAEFELTLSWDSLHARAAIGLAELALGGREPEELRAAARALATVARDASAPAAVWLWRARLAAPLNDGEGARYAARFAELGGDAALARLAEARARFAAGQDSAGSAAYFAGVDALSPVAADAYYDDLVLIVRAPERATWEKALLSERAAWLRQFWARRAAESGVAAELRVPEHYSRLATAHRRYARASERASSAADFRSIPHELRAHGLDDRGVVYVLHGEPDTVVSTLATELRPNESWLYRRPDGSLLFHFAALRRGQEYLLVADPLEAFEGGSPASASLPLCPGAGSACSFDEAIVDVYQDRASLDARYGLMVLRYRRARADPSGEAARSFGNDRAHLAGEVRGSAQRALRRDTHVPDLGEPLPFYYDVYEFRGEWGRTDVVVAVAVPGGAVPAVAGEDGVMYPLDLALLLVDTVSGASYESDSARVFRSVRALGRKEHVRAIIELSAPPGAYRHRIAVRSRGEFRAGGAYGGPTRVRDFSGDSLLISDLILAESSGRGWQRGSVELGLVPPRRFVEGATVSLFYELYNLPPGARFRTRIKAEPMSVGLLGRVKRLLGAQSAPLSLSFEDLAQPDAAGRMQLVRQLGLQSLRRGAYRLIAEAELGERTVRRSTEFVIQ